MIDYQAIVADMQKIVFAKAAKDPAFKAQFLANPRGVVESTFKIQLPAHIKVEAQQAAPNTVVVVLPHATILGAGGELSDADLEAVAGGSKSEAERVFKGIGSGVGIAAGVGVVVAAPEAAGAVAAPVGAMADACF